ncbi:hypothetical protein HZY62_19580 [Maribacter polysiphoniae]|uniref:Uncharacterized protein n=1 Tax=Maribacter polysiphoniae TaxID=429344 RepID=A0A316EB22_9FLAO|nr:hypothetical protein [Maribacter polysiphoniae]MBD1262808.1 hypothetical protein [Maribacter polysiphoniae]PWK20120.1 hypothetical protein LX92_04063 [Maribacter polysiphoniae]
MEEKKTRLQLEYELKLTKKILERLIELNEDKNLVMPEDAELDNIEAALKKDMEQRYPKYKIQKR